MKHYFVIYNRRKSRIPPDNCRQNSHCADKNQNHTHENPYETPPEMPVPTGTPPPAKNLDIHRYSHPIYHQDVYSSHRHHSCFAHYSPC